MIKLSKEGKPIPKNLHDNFPNYDYWDIYCEVYGAGERSTLGVKRMITNRLNKLTTTNASQQQAIIDKINDLVYDFTAVL